MKVALTQFYNEPKEFLGLSPSFKRLVMDRINTEILSGIWKASKMSWQATPKNTSMFALPTLLC